MKRRGISAFIALCIFIPILCYGKTPYALAIFILSLQGMKEMLSARSKQKEIPIFIEGISYLLISYFTLTTIGEKDITIFFNLQQFIGILIFYLLPVIIYQNDKTYGIIDAFFMIGMTSFVCLCFSLLIIIRNANFIWTIYLFLITIFTDTYAYLTGKLIGRHKCIPTISPNKTWEGCIGGTFFGVYVATTYFLTVADTACSVLFIFLMTLFLSIMGQFGDLFFSSIKRKFQIKDFSNFMPGHGGILDRFDSIFFVLLAFTFFIPFL